METNDSIKNKQAGVATRIGMFAVPIAIFVLFNMSYGCWSLVTDVTWAIKYSKKMDKRIIEIIGRSKKDISP